MFPDEKCGLVFDLPSSAGLWLDAVSPLISKTGLPEQADACRAGGQGTADLTRLLALGDEDAFREFHRLYFDRLYRFVLLVCRGDETQARDALQDTFCRVARHVRRFEEEDVFWCWLVALARSSARDAGRKRHRYWKLLADYARRWLPVEGAHDEAPGHYIEEQMLGCVNELEADDRALVEGKYFTRLSTDELARRSGKTTRAVESRLFRLRAVLRTRFLDKLRKDPP
jgi:RNA polymerase sigma-70 factor (ECF subfamily)